jgi:hypothetical protein
MSNTYKNATFQGLTRLEGEVHFLSLPKKWFSKFRASDTTPEVTNVEFWQANNTAPTTITNFDKGQDAQCLHILGEGFTTIAHNANIKTNTGANKLLLADKVYTIRGRNYIRGRYV